MSASYEPIPVVLGTGPNRLKQYIFYDDSRLVRELRFFPYVQLLFVGLFILVGYLGFSYVRRSEQSSLWVGMAKEAAHQLGTPISSLMGWTELMKSGELTTEQQEDAIEEIENDIQRLSRVASRFSDIGSLPKLDVRPVAPVVEATAEYIRRRMPRQARSVELNVSVPPELRAPLNAELFEWVIENLLKNALDAIESDRGSIDITAQKEGGRVLIDVKDSGKGIDRRNWKNVFRPGYSTKKRGWGLGLSLAKRIVEDYHGGSLTLVSSRVGYGTTFRIALPEGRAEGGSVRKGM
ncbi:MAG: HAMP domain-containing sensor histidine kinase [Rhodothermales bacterium]